MRIASLTILLCLALAAIPALAQQQLYENGPVNGTTDAWTINFGYIVSDTFVCCNGSPDWDVEGVHIGVWEFPGDVMNSLDWSITSGENGGTVFGSGTANGNNITDTFISTNQFGYDVDWVHIKFPSVDIFPGQYWLNLANATVPSGDPVYWDENSGTGCSSPGCPSSASESSVGTIPSEAFTIYGTPTGGTTPEPSSIILFGSGILGLAGLLRHKLF